MKIYSIVEGQGDEVALPVLLRRLQNEANTWELQFARPHRRHRPELVQKNSLQQAVEFAALHGDCQGILILLDADDDCPSTLAPVLQAWAQEVAHGKACAVVMANREYEAWFLASIESLSDSKGATSHPTPEAPRDAKGQLESLMPGLEYSSTRHQASFTANFDMNAAYLHCRSFRKLVKAFGELATAAGAQPGNWPPQAWGS
jgi:hypothetical protein